MISPLSKMVQQRADERRARLKRAFIQRDAKIGGQLFGEIPVGTRREFFCLDTHTWVWHEEWTDIHGPHAVTTRYDVRPNGILKSQGTQSYQRLTAEELTNFKKAVALYQQRVGDAYRDMLGISA